MNAQLKKGVLEICILKLLEQKDCYGYEMIRDLKEDFPGTEESTVYAILRRLNRENYTEVYLKDSTPGPGRKYYRITQEGQEYLKGLAEDFYVLYGIVQKYDSE